MRSRVAWVLVASLSPALAYADKPATVAIFDIEDTRAEGALTPKVVDGLTEYLTTRLGEDALFAVVPRANVRKALSQEKADSYKACFDQSCQIEVGKALAAEKTISTRIAKVGSSCVLTAQLYDLRTEVSEQSATARGPCDENALLDGVERIVGKMREHLGKGASPPPAAEPEGRTSERSASARTDMVRLLQRMREVAATRGLEQQDLSLIDGTKDDANAFAAAQRELDEPKARAALDRLMISIPRAQITLAVCRAKLARIQEAVRQKERTAPPATVDKWYVDQARLAAAAKPNLEPAQYEALAKELEQLRIQVLGRGIVSRGNR